MQEEPLGELERHLVGLRFLLFAFIQHIDEVVLGFEHLEDGLKDLVVIVAWKDRNGSLKLVDIYVSKLGSQIGLKWIRVLWCGLLGSCLGVR